MNKILPQYESIESVKVKIFSSAANNKRSIKDHKETNNKNIVEQGLNALVKNSNDESKWVSATLKLQANKPKGIKESRYLNIIDNLDVKISQKPAENEGSKLTLFVEF